MKKKTSKKLTKKQLDTIRKFVKSVKDDSTNEDEVCRVAHDNLNSGNAFVVVDMMKDEDGNATMLTIYTIAPNGKRSEFPVMKNYAVPE